VAPNSTKHSSSVPNGERTTPAWKFEAAIDLATGALHQNCDDTVSRKILGLAQYVKWAATTGPVSAESLNQARIFLPAGPKPLYLLATSDRTTPAAKKLIASGEPIDQQDNERLTALAYALQNRDLAAARRLLMLGALIRTRRLGRQDCL
jgi:hypothetical protein